MRSCFAKAATTLSRRQTSLRSDASFLPRMPIPVAATRRFAKTYRRGSVASSPRGVSQREISRLLSLSSQRPHDSPPCRNTHLFLPVRVPGGRVRIRLSFANPAKHAWLSNGSAQNALTGKSSRFRHRLCQKHESSGPGLRREKALASIRTATPLSGRAGVGLSMGIPRVKSRPSSRTTPAQRASAGSQSLDAHSRLAKNTRLSPYETRGRRN